MSLLKNITLINNIYINCGQLISFSLLFRRPRTQLIEVIVVMKMCWPNFICELLVNLMNIH